MCKERLRKWKTFKKNNLKEWNHKIKKYDIPIKVEIERKWTYRKRIKWSEEIIII